MDHSSLQIGGQCKLNILFTHDQLLQRGTLVLKKRHDLLDQPFRGRGAGGQSHNINALEPLILNGTQVIHQVGLSPAL